MPDATRIGPADRERLGDNAALELLPESLGLDGDPAAAGATVYQIGKAYGYELDQGHIKEFVATLGVGLTGQYVEQFGRKLLGGLLGTVMGGVGRGVGHQAASSGVAFATTWAIDTGRSNTTAAVGRSMAPKLKSAFAPLLEQGQAMARQARRRDCGARAHYRRAQLARVDQDGVLGAKARANWAKAGFTAIVARTLRSRESVRAKSITAKAARDPSMAVRRTRLVDRFDRFIGVRPATWERRLHSRTVGRPQCRCARHLGASSPASRACRAQQFSGQSLESPFECVSLGLLMALDRPSRQFSRWSPDCWTQLRNSARYLRRPDSMSCSA
jgi:hypothetical protein